MPGASSFSKSFPTPTCSGQGPEVPKPSGGQAHLRLLRAALVTIIQEGSLSWAWTNRGGLGWQSRLTGRPQAPAFCPRVTKIHICTRARGTLPLPRPLFQVPGPSSSFPPAPVHTLP